MKTSTYQLAMTQVAEPRGQPIYSRGGYALGRTTGGSRPCACGKGPRIGVRWRSGVLTYPCTTAMLKREDGAREIE